MRTLENASRIFESIKKMKKRESDQCTERRNTKVLRENRKRRERSTVGLTMGVILPP